MRREIMPAELELVANLCTKDVNVASLLEMKVGDVIPLNLSQEIEVTVENLPVLACRYGTSNGQYALRVEKLLKFDSNETARRS
jgi:flagellar motor switch protein FliM